MHLNYIVCTFLLYQYLQSDQIELMLRVWRVSIVVSVLFRVFVCVCVWTAWIPARPDLNWFHNGLTSFYDQYNDSTYIGQHTPQQLRKSDNDPYTVHPIPLCDLINQ